MVERLLRWLGLRPAAAAPSVRVGPVPPVESTAQPVPASAASTAAPVLIDVRTEREFATVALPGALNLPLGQLEQRIRETVADAATPLVLYCASGARSAAACQLLRQMGYRQVDNAGGLYAAAARLGLQVR